MMNRRGFTGALAAAVVAGPVMARKAAFEDAGAQVVKGFPRGDGFWMPAEWEPHERTLMQFPSPQNWYRRTLSDVRVAWAKVANTIAEYEPVTVGVRPADRERASAVLSAGIELIDMPLNDAWARDTGPLVVINKAGLRRVAGFQFNGWGRKFDPYARDALVKARFAAHLKLPMYSSDMVLEGGAVAVDGQGTVLSTWENLVHSQRNPRWGEDKIVQEVKAFLGAEAVITLPQGVVPDAITDGHIDRMAAFAAPGAVLLHSTADRNTPNYRILQEAQEVLQEARDAQGRKLEVIDVPLTSELVAHMNFYICNGAVIVPLAESGAEDDGPLGVLREVFPRHKVVGVPLRASNAASAVPQEPAPSTAICRSLIARGYQKGPA